LCEASFAAAQIHLRSLPNPHARVAEAAFDRQSNRGVSAERDRLGHEAIRASYPPRGNLNHTHLPLKTGRDLDRNIVGGRYLSEPGLNAVVHNVEDNVGPVVILYFEDNGFRVEGFRRRGGQRIRSHGMSARAAKEEAGHDETRGECSAAACHVFSDANVAAPCRDGYRNVLHGPSRVERQFTVDQCRRARLSSISANAK
jgi:hypothetical protein